MPMTLVAVGTGEVTLYNNSDISHNQNSNNITRSRVIDSYNVSASSQVPAAFEENLADASFKDERRRRGHNRQAPAHDDSAWDHVTGFEREEEYDDEPLWQIPDHPFYLRTTTQPSSSQPVPEAFMSPNSRCTRVNSENFYPETELQSPQQFPAQVRSPGTWNSESSHPGHGSSSHPFTTPPNRKRAPGGSRNIRHEVEAYDEHESIRRRSVSRGRPATRKARQKARGSRNEASTLHQIPQSPHPHTMVPPHFPSMNPYYSPNGASSPVPNMHHWAPSAPLNPCVTMIPTHYQPQPSPAYWTTTYTIVQPVPISPSFMPPESQLYSPTPHPVAQPVPFGPSFISPESRLYSPAPRPAAGPVFGSASFIQPPPESHHALYHHSPNPFTPSRDIYYNTHPHMGTTTPATAHYQTTPTPDHFPSRDLPSHALPRSGWLHEGRSGMIGTETSSEAISPTLRERLKRETAQRVSYADMPEPVSKRSRRG